MNADAKMSPWARLVHFFQSFGPGAGRALVSILVHHLDIDSEGVVLVRSMLVGAIGHGEASDQIREIEHRGDRLRTELVGALTRALVTPIDREDIYRLSRSIDDVLDGLRDFVREWNLFRPQDSQALLRVLDAIATAVVDTRAAVVTISASPDATSREVLLALRSTSRIRLVHEDEIAALFDGEVTMGVLRQRELLHRLDAIGLHLVQGSNIIGDAFVKRGE
ncbi:MAG: DUF47 domain-containing protein [Ferrimicrobium sp.]